jgi:hypothetical protein
MILSNSFADSHIKIMKLNKPIEHCYTPAITTFCNKDKVAFNIFVDSTPSFIIADNISINQSWSELISNKCIVAKNRHQNYKKVECPIDSERFVVYSFYLPTQNFIELLNIDYHTCSNTDKEKITESLISKFKKNQMVSVLNPNQIHFIQISDKNSTLSAGLFQGNFSSGHINATELALRCPGDVRLILTITHKAVGTGDVIRKFMSQDSIKSTPKF